MFKCFVQEQHRNSTMPVSVLQFPQSGANGQPIKWEIFTPAGASNLNQYFIDNGINISVVHVAQSTIL